ncbi:hypothetical protein ACJMK2_013519 [Sinanodonta woodiana]|uniref:F5/8 type C domain-containing protein n=1 Tax=Sinanodonta woodiana TaxID=1069815 RepID=A0ABD3V107_SINWO
MSVSSIIGKKRDLVTPGNQRCLYCCTTNLCNNNCSGFVNLALHKPAYQSSVDFNGPPNLAVDGNKDPNYYHGSCIHSAPEPFPWWAVDLGNNFSITAIKIYNRNDAGGDERFMHLKILVSSQNATVLPRASPAFQECGNYIGHSSDGNIITINCPGHTVGRWVRIQAVVGTLEYFHFCEVEVFGY